MNTLYANKQLFYYASVPNDAGQYAVYTDVGTEHVYLVGYYTRQQLNEATETEILA